MPYLAMVLLIVSILCALVGFADDNTGKGDMAVARAVAMVSGVSFLVVAVLAAVRGLGAAEERDEA